MAKASAYAIADAKPELNGEDKFRTAFKVGNDEMTISEAVRPAHLWLVGARGGEPRRLTNGTWSLPSSLPPGPPSSPIAWSKDGKSILLVRAGDAVDRRPISLPHPGARRGRAVRIRSLTGETMLEGYPVLSPDGSDPSRIGATAMAHAWNYQDVLAGPLPRAVRAWASARALDKNVYGTRGRPSGEWLLVGANIDSTAGWLWRLRVNGTATRIDLGPVVPVNSFWMDADIDREGKIAFIGQTKTDPYEVYVIPYGRWGRRLALTHLNCGALRFDSGPLPKPSPGRDRAAARWMAWSRIRPIIKRAWRYPLVLDVHWPPKRESRASASTSCRSCWLRTTGWCSSLITVGSDNSGNAFFAAIYKDAGQGTGVRMSCPAWRS